MKPILVTNFLPEEVYKNICLFVNGLQFEDGKRTAKGKAKDLKNNLQGLVRSPKEHLSISNIISFMMATNLFQSYLYARRMSTPMINKYQVGMSYDQHIDRAFMRDVRTDYSYTYFLSDPGDYQGGELEIATGQNKPTTVKGEANSIVIYESLQQHKVTEVTSGERVCMVGWIESSITSEERRVSVRNLQDIQKKLGPILDADQHQDIIVSLNLEIQKILRFLSQ